MKLSFICSDISTVSRNDRVFITHLLSLGLREMEIKTRASSQKETHALMVLRQMLTWWQSKRKHEGYQDTFPTDVPKMTLLGKLSGKQ